MNFRAHAANAPRSLTIFAAVRSASASTVKVGLTAPIVGNSPPVASPHLLTFTPAPGARTLTIDVLAGDSDIDGDTLTVVGVTDASGGPLTINPDGTVTYAPREDFAGREVFTYTIQDSAGNRSTATVQVEVINTAPVAVDDTVTAPGATPTVVDVVGNDTDDNGDQLTVKSAGPTSTQGGIVSVAGGVLTYTPATGFRGTDTFTYVVEDTRGGSDTATVTVTVTNNVPDAVNDAYATNAGTAVAVSVRGNDTDPDGDTLTVTRLAGPAHGTLTLNASGVGTYTPAAGWSGTDTFTYRVADGFGGTDDATVTITVNGAPVAVNDTATTGPNTAVNVAVLGNDTDPDGDTLTTTAITVAPTHGSAVVQSNGSITYTPAAGWAGVDTYTYRVSDGRGLTATATVQITTTNASPVTTPDAVSTGTDTPAVNVDVLGNDTDPNITAGVPGQALSVTGATADNGATVVVNPDSTLTITPAPGYAGPVTVTYTVSDNAGGTATGTLTVTVANGAPSAVSDGPVTTPTGTSTLIDVLDNDTDPNGDTLTLVPGSLTTPVDANGDPRGTVAIDNGQVRYTPPAGWAGTATFTYEVSDGAGGTATGTVTVTVANGDPIATDDAATTPAGTAVEVDVLDNDTDPNIPGTDQELAVIGAVADNGATVVVNPDGTLTVTPAPGYEGPITVTYTVGDGAGGIDEGELVVTVGNAAPVADPDAATTGYATAVEVDLLDNDTDPNPGDTLTVVPGSVSDPVDATGTPRGTVTLTGGVATYTPPAGFSGVITFAYTLTDGTDTDEATVTITVANAAPVAVNDSASTGAGKSVAIDVLGNDTDPNGGTATITAVTQPAHGAVTIVDGRVIYTPAAGYAGTDTFTYTITDAAGATSTATVSVQVRAADAPPTPPTGPNRPTGPLATTGAQVTTAAGIAAALLLLGGALVWARRRLTA